MESPPAFAWAPVNNRMEQRPLEQTSDGRCCLRLCAAERRV